LPTDAALRQQRGASRPSGTASSSSSAASAAQQQHPHPQHYHAASPGGGLWCYVIDTSEAARSEDVAPSRARFALSSVRSLSKAALALPHAPDDAAVVVAAGTAPRVLVPPGADDGGLLFSDPWQPAGGAALGGSDSFSLLPALRLALLLCRQRAARPAPLQLPPLMQQRTQAPSSAAALDASSAGGGSATGGRVVVFVCSGTRLADSDVGGALAAFSAASALHVGLDVVLLGGAATEVDRASQERLRRIIDGLNGVDGSETTSTSSSSTSSSSTSSTSISNQDATDPVANSNTSISDGATVSSTSIISSPAVAATPLPKAAAAAVAAAAAATRPQQPPRARLVCFDAPDPDLPSWQQVEPLLELLELPISDQHDLEYEVGAVVWRMPLLAVSTDGCYQPLHPKAHPLTARPALSPLPTIITTPKQPHPPGPAGTSVRPRGAPGPTSTRALALGAAAAAAAGGGRLASRLRQRLLGPSLFSSRALRPCRCRHESLDSLHHLSHDGFMHSWLPSYANPAKVRACACSVGVWAVCGVFGCAYAVSLGGGG